MPEARLESITVHYEVEGEGPALIMIMGLGCPGALWRYQVPELSRHFRVITFDNRGIGRSTKPPGPYSTDIMADDTAELMHHLGIERAHVLGMSMGGAIAQKVAIRHPELVDHLILSCTWCGTNRFGQELLGAWRAVAERAGMDTLTQLNLAQYLTPACYVNKPQLVSELSELLGATAQPVVSYVAQNLACQTHEACERLASIRAKTLILVGSRDGQTTVGAAKEMAGLIPGSRLVALKGLGHGLMWEDPERYNQTVLDFLLPATTAR
jgi:pimeloyl-ACP methyl ester carboxylesterase